MAIYIDEKNRIKDIFINVDGEKKKVTSVWCDKNSVPTKVFSRNTSSLDVSWANGTIEEISKILDMHYAGEIDISEHWRVGDERVVHLSAMPSWNSTYGESQPEQDVTLVIIGFNFDTMQTEPLPAKAGRFGKLLKQPKGSASQLLFFILLFSNFKVVRVTSLL